jgi:uncharacterized small protein (DUF1192 family)
MGKREDILRANLSIALGAACVFLLGLTTAGANAASLPSQEEMWRIIQAQQREIKTLKAELQQLETQPAEAPQAIPQKPQEPAQKEQKVEELEHKAGVLAEEVEKLRTQMVIPEEPKYKSMYGLGPAASKVYQISKGVSIGGYGEAFYQNLVEDEGDRRNSADLVRLVLYTGYRFTDRILFNSEIEFEHATTGEGDEEKGEVWAYLRVGGGEVQEHDKR